MKKYFLLVMFCTSQLFAQNPTFQRVKRANRRFDAKTTRATVANQDARQNMQPQLTNGDEQLYADKRASFGKALAQLDSGLISPEAFNQMVTAIQNGDSDAFLNITMGTSNPVQRKLVNPQAAFAFNLDGADGWINVMPAAPAFASAEAAGEMVELYWHALLRDVAFNAYSTMGTAAVADLNKLSDFRGPKENGVVTTGTLFRGNAPGELVGPLVSQFLYLAVPYGPGPNYDGTLATAGISFQAQVVPTSSTTNDFMTTFATWSSVQKGENPTATITYAVGARTFIRNARDLGDYVHQDLPMQPYENAARILLSFGADALDKNNPYLNNPTQESFVTYGPADIFYLLGVGSETALRTAWYQKYVVHRRLRPEFFGFLANQQKSGAQDFGINSELIDSDALTQTNATFMSYFLPQAYPEGSPTHPSYPAGHATVAGCLATLLKAFFNESFEIPSPVEPNAGNTALVAYTGDALTVGGELNKLASNISLGRDMAGVHYRSDGWQGMLLGEKIAISILEDEAYTRNINFNGYSLTTFEGKTITVGAKRTAPKING